MAGGVTLYPADHPFWLTDARLLDSGSLLVTSGDASNEWMLVVAPDALPALALALGRPDARGGDLLSLLRERFGGTTNPYEAIADFFGRHGVAFRRDCWLG